MKKALFFMAMLVVLAYPTYALTTINAQSGTTCDVTGYCETTVNLGKYLTTQAISIVKNTNYSQTIDAIEHETSLKNMGYKFINNSIVIYGRTIENTYWSIDLKNGFVIDPWWNTSFPYCQNITVTSGKANYPAFINVTYNANMQSDFDDVRFVNNSCGENATIMSYMLRHKNNSNWATYDLLLDGTQNISMYYGNALASTLSNVTAVWGASLVGYWTFDECSGNVVSDLSGNNLNGYFNGTFNTSYKMYGCGGSFTGTQDVEIASNNLLNISNNITLEAYFRANSWNLYNGVLGKRKAVTTWYQFSINQEPSNSGAHHEYYDGTTATESTAYNYTVNTLYYYSTTVGSGGKMNFTYNNTMFANYTGKAIGAGSNQNVTIGTAYQVGTDGFKGMIDEVRLFNTSLDPTQHYANPTPTFSFGSEQTEGVTPINKIIDNTVVCFKTRPVCINLKDSTMIYRGEGYYD